MVRLNLKIKKCVLFCPIFARPIVKENTLFFDWLSLLKKKIQKLIFYFFILSCHSILISLKIYLFLSFDHIYKLVLNALNVVNIFPYWDLQFIRNDLPPGGNALRMCSCIMKHRVSAQLTLGRRDVDCSYA